MPSACILRTAHSKSSLTSISYLAQVVVKALGDDAMRKAFDLPDGQTKYDLIDKIRAQYQEYQTEDISESLYKHIEAENNSNKEISIHSSRKHLIGRRLMKLLESLILRQWTRRWDSSDLMTTGSPYQSSVI